MKLQKFEIECQVSSIVHMGNVERIISNFGHLDDQAKHCSSNDWYAWALTSVGGAFGTKTHHFLDSKQFETTWHILSCCYFECQAILAL
jgi:hypothetical protein